MGRVRNFLFIMCDQLRADYLSCNGHPTLQTPHIDALAARGVNLPVPTASRRSAARRACRSTPGATCSPTAPPGTMCRCLSAIRQRGYVSDNPWHDFANAVEGPNGEVLNGGEMRHAHLPARLTLGLAPHEARAFMVRTADWKYIHYEHFRPQLFDLNDDPHERHDLGTNAAHADTRAALHERLFTWLRTRRTRTAIADDTVAQHTATTKQRGIYIGVW